MFHFSTRNALLPSAAMTILLGLSACGGGGGSDDTSASASASASAAAAAAGTASGAAAGAGAAAGTVTTNPTPQPALPTKALGLTDQRASPAATPNVVRLVSFDIATPNTVTSVPITTAAGAGAFAANEWIFGMDYRPADSLLWGLTNRGRLYTIDPGTGVATFRFALSADAADTTAPFTGLDASTSVSVDFNPVADRMRVVTFVGQNLSINVATGATTTDTSAPAVAAPPAPAAGFSWIAGVAYANSFAGATATTLYTINNVNDNLSTQTPPAGGTQTAVGTGLTVAIGEVQGFDIAGSTNQLALAALSPDGAVGPHALYNINLTSGVATLRGTSLAASQIGGATGVPLVDIAIRP